MERSCGAPRGRPGALQAGNGGRPKARQTALRLAFAIYQATRAAPRPPSPPLGGHSPCEGRSGAIAAERRCRVLQQHRERRCRVFPLRLEAAYQLPASRSCQRCWQAIPCLPSAFRLACPAAPAGGAVACRPRPQNGDACVNERALVVQALLRPGRSRGRSAKASAPKPPRQILFDRLPKGIGPVARRLVRRQTGQTLARQTGQTLAARAGHARSARGPAVPVRLCLCRACTVI